MSSFRVLGFLVALALPMLSCSHQAASPARTMEYATLLKVENGRIISVCPFDGSEDTLVVDQPLSKVICMSTSHIAFLDAIGCDSVICGVSGAGYVSSEALRQRLDAGKVYDVGYDQAPDYERIVALQPDILLAYTVSAAESPFIAKLKSLGIRVFTLYEFLEDHPLGRAEYLRAFGLLTGREAAADSLFQEIATKYNSIACPSTNPVRVLMNIPYGDIWYVPGADSYMSRLVKDAGGQILGAREGDTESRAISLEEAFVLAQEADFWLNVGWCRTLEELESANPLFKDFQIQKVFNNIRRTNPGGGNDFWESGYVRPDLILQDLRTIFSTSTPTNLTYYLSVN